MEKIHYTNRVSPIMWEYIRIRILIHKRSIGEILLVIIYCETNNNSKCVWWLIFLLSFTEEWNPSNVELTNGIELRSTGCINTFITKVVIKTQTILSYPTIRITITPHEVSNTLLTFFRPGPVTFRFDIVSSSPPAFFVSLNIHRIQIRIISSVYTLASRKFRCILM